MSGWSALAVALAVWAAYKLGRWRETYSQYVRGYMEGYDARVTEHVEAQRENAARGLQ